MDLKEIMIKAVLCRLNNNLVIVTDRLSGLVASVPGCKSRSPGFDYRCYQMF
jgi:hypothetical protein